jgi:hypothetical protein
MFYAGQKVVCVDDRWQRYFLQKGRIYIVEGDSFVGVAGKTYVCVAGVRGSSGLAGFYTSRFRPLVEKKTDISVFTALLKPVRQDA